MRRMLLMLGSGMLLAALSANAQYPDGRRGGYESNWQDRGRGYGGNVIERVLRDVDRAASYRDAARHEREHFDQARKNLTRFQDNWSRGKFDKDRLDGAIDDLHRLSGSDHLSRRDRDVLARDMEALRDFRESGGRANGYRRY